MHIPGSGPLVWNSLVSERQLKRRALRSPPPDLPHSPLATKRELIEGQPGQVYSMSYAPASAVDFPPLPPSGTAGATSDVVPE